MLVLGSEDKEPEGCIRGFVTDEISCYVKVIGLIDLKLELNRVAKREKQLKDLADKLQKKCEAPAYLTKTPENVRQANQEKLEGYKIELVELTK